MVAARPNSAKTLSDGVVIEASVVARLLGVKLLRLRAHVTVLPADLERSPYLEAPVEFEEPVARGPEPLHAPAASGTLADAVKTLEHASLTMRHLKPADRSAVPRGAFG